MLECRAMSFLFGDLTSAPFATNLLEELRDAIDFAASVADADQLIATADAMRDALRKRSEDDISKLDAVIRGILSGAASINKGSKDSPASQLAAHVEHVLAERRKVLVAAVKGKLADDQKSLESAVLAARGDYFGILEKWLLVRVPPSSKQTLRVRLAFSKKDDSTYTADIAGESDVGL